MDDLTYAEVGATRHGPLPPGYRHLRYQMDLGRVDFDAAAEAVLTFAVLRAAGELVEASTPRAAVGGLVISRIGIGPLRLRVPCRVVWVQQVADRAGFAYGTLPGHPARGEESFVVTRDEAGVSFAVTSFSVPAHWSMAALGPVAPFLQAAYVRRRARALRKLLSGTVSGG
jgi:uncharacterized protein (UPF0548 family)